jgi:acetoin utilization deacetylase AcuC-like enzyme
MHGAKNFPFRKAASDLDVELPDGCTDAPYLDALHQSLQTLESRFAPDLIFYLAGADPHENDRLGRLKLSFAGLQARDQTVLRWARDKRLPLAMAMAGGYGRDLADTVQVQITSFALAQASWQDWQNDPP